MKWVFLAAGEQNISMTSINSSAVHIVMVVQRQTAGCLQEAPTKTWDNAADETNLYKKLHKLIAQAKSGPVADSERKVDEEGGAIDFNKAAGWRPVCGGLLCGML